MALSNEVEILFHSLADLDDGERSRYFESHLTDPVVRQQVEALLACDQSSNASLTALLNRQIDSALKQTSELGERSFYGPYRLLRLLGRGGMAEVWLAERTDGLLKRSIALKLPYSGNHASHFAERLYRERDILATLEHQGIARLYDAGFEAGRPFLALELVEGVDLSTYCNSRRLPVKERLRLFLQVLDAVQYAHSRLVIHRDLKPGNILVTPNGDVKLLDFGIAKLMAAGEAPETELTRFEGRALTLSFASPEQITGKPVTTASDVFSLGMILSELISGGRLFVPKRDTRGGLEEAILNDEPRRPSQAVTAAQQGWERSLTVWKLQRVLKGDLDVIVMKAIQKRPEDRYPTAEAFRADVQRYLQDKAVLAQPERPFYRAGKFALRHKLGVLSATAVFLALSAGLSAALWQASVARKEARTANAVQQFTEDIFRANSRANPDPVKAQQTTARQLLDLGAKRAATSLADAPEAKLRMLEILGLLYQDLGLEDQGVYLQKERLASAKKRYGAQSLNVAPILIDLANCMHASRSVNEEEAVLLEAQSILNRHGDFASATRGRLLSSLAENYASSDVAQASKAAKESVDVLRNWPPSSDLAAALYTAGVVYIHAGQFADAETSLNEALQLSKRFHGDPNPDLPRYYAFEAQAQMALMQYAAAESSHYQAYQYAKKLGGEDDMDTLETESRLGTFLVLTSRAREALPYLKKAEAICVRVRGADEPFYTPQMQLQYGMALDAYGRPEEALEQISKAVKNRRAHRPGTAYLAQMLEDEAGVLIELGRVRQAGPILNEAEAIHKKANIKIDDNYLVPRLHLTMAQGRLADAATLVSRYYGEIATNSPVSKNLIRNMLTRAEIALQRKDGRTAVSMSQSIQNRLVGTPFEKYLAIMIVRAQLVQGLGHMLEGDAQTALPLLKKAAEAQLALLDANSPELGATEATLGQAYLETGNRRQAESLLRSAESRLQAHRELSERYRRPVLELRRRLVKRTGSG